jgi:Fur family ferric uptake transcriptional regulator
MKPTPDQPGRDECRRRMTAQRRIILRELQRMARKHPTAEEIFLRVRKVLPRISLGTVYRNIDVLHRCGQALKVEPGSPQMRFDGRVDDHYHIRCVRCGMVDDLELPACPDIRKAVKDDMGFEILGHRLEFVGLCPKCRGESRVADRAAPAKPKAEQGESQIEGSKEEKRK